jgi:hypothetical protein
VNKTPGWAVVGKVRVDQSKLAGAIFERKAALFKPVNSNCARWHSQIDKWVHEKPSFQPMCQTK